MNWFKNKKQQEEIKKLPLLEKTIKVETDLKLAGLRIEFSATQVKPYTARITYKEKPQQWRDEGNQSKIVEIFGDDWSDLVSKVVEHFEPGILRKGRF